MEHLKYENYWPLVEDGKEKCKNEIHERHRVPGQSTGVQTGLGSSGSPRSKPTTRTGGQGDRGKPL